MRRTRFVGRGFKAIAVAVVILMLGAGTALADNIQDDVVSSEQIRTITAGASTDVKIWIDANSSGGKSFDGCDATASSPANITINKPAAVSVSGATLQTGNMLVFSECGNSTTGYQTVTYSSSTVDDHSISVSVSDGFGNYNVNPAAFTLRVTAPANTPPSVSVTGVSNGSTYEKSLVPQPGCSVTDAEDSSESASPQISNPPFDSLGSHTVTCSYTDGGGLTGSATASYTVVRDRDTSAPVISSVVTGTLGGGGWYTSDVTLKWTVTESESPETLQMNGCGDQSITSDQPATDYTCSATSEGGTASETVSIKRDATAPNANCDSADGNWHASNVTILCNPTDSGSGYNGGQVSLSTNVAAGDEDANASTDSKPISDVAGNTATAGPVAGNKIDRKAPAANCGSADGNWHPSNVTILCNPTDSGSGYSGGQVSLSTNVAAGDEDANASTDSKTISDNVGNTATAGPVAGNKIDRKGPTYSCDPVPAGWSASDVSISCGVSDGGSGYSGGSVSLSTNVPVGTETDNASTDSKVVQDAVGNSTTVGPLSGIKVDKKDPSIVFGQLSGTLGSNGWYTSAVTATFNCSDGGSGIVGPTSSDTLAADGANQTANGTCLDNVGHSANASLGGINIDQTDPDNISFQGGPAAGASYLYGSVPAEPTCSADDDTSGLDTCVVSGYSAAVGSHTMTATATDRAGNQATAQRSYTVDPWTLRGFFQPVDMNGVWNTVKGGSTVPLKFEIFSGSTELTTTSSVKSFTVKGVACPSSSVVTDDIELTTTGGTSLRYDTTGGQFIQNWQTPKKPGACYTVTMTSQDGSTLSANFLLK